MIWRKDGGWEVEELYLMDPVPPPTCAAIASLLPLPAPFASPAPAARGASCPTDATPPPAARLAPTPGLPRGWERAWRGEVQQEAALGVKGPRRVRV